MIVLTRPDKNRIGPLLLNDRSRAYKQTDLHPRNTMHPNSLVVQGNERTV